MPRKRSLSRTAPIAFAFLAAGTTASQQSAAAADRLPDGVYHCEVYMLGMFLDLGDITIRGNVYSGPSFSGGPQQSYNYQVNRDGEITWLGPLGGYTAGGNSVSLTQITAEGEKDASFDIIMRQPDGAFTASTCTIRPPTEKS